MQSFSLAPSIPRPERALAMTLWCPACAGRISRIVVLQAIRDGLLEVSSA